MIELSSSLEVLHRSMTSGLTEGSYMTKAKFMFSVLMKTVRKRGGREGGERERALIYL